MNHQMFHQMEAEKLILDKLSTSKQQVFRFSFKKPKVEKDILSRKTSILRHSSELESMVDDVFQDGCSNLTLEKNDNKKCKSSSSWSSCDSRIFDKPSKSYRLLVIGPSKVGKTSLIRQFLYKTHSYEHIQTVHQMFLGDFEHADSQVSLTIEDTGPDFSQEFPAMMEVSLQATDGIILVFSLTDKQSFEEKIHILKLPKYSNSCSGKQDRSSQGARQARNRGNSVF